MIKIDGIGKLINRPFCVGSAALAAFLFLVCIGCNEEARGPDSDGGEDLDSLAGEDHSDWSACEVIGEYCLPTDTTIIATNCMPDENGTIHFGSRNHCTGDCICGFVSWTGFPCDDYWFECSDGMGLPYQYAYCETGRRILCSHDVSTRAIVRVGCCDEAGYAYCERDPRPDSNICE